MTSLEKDMNPEENAEFNFNMIMCEALSLQFDQEKEASSKPTSSQPFHLSEKRWLPVNLLYNIPDCD